MKFLYELFLYFLDRLDDLCYEIDEWRRESPVVSRHCVMAILGFVLGLIFLSGCTLPTGTRKVVAWGVFLPTPTGVPIGVGYWHSEHGEAVVGEESAKPNLPTTVTPSLTSTPSGLDEWMCMPDGSGKVLHCGSYEAWARWEEEQRKKNGL